MSNTVIVPDVSKIIKRGYYTVRISKAKEETIKNKRVLNFEYIIIKGKRKGFRFNEKIYFSGKSYLRFGYLCSAAGIQEKNIDPGILVGKLLVLLVVPEDDNYRGMWSVKNKIRMYHPLNWKS